MATESDKGTDKEQLEQDETVQDEIFRDAFDLAEKGIGASDDSSQGDRGGDADNKTNAQSETTPEDKGQLSDPASTDNKTTTDSSAADNSNSTASHTKEDDATYEQRWKSLNGILKSTNEKYEAEKARLTSELEALTKKVEELSKVKGDKDAADKSKAAEEDLTDDQKKLLEAYDSEFDTVSKMEGIKREKALKALEKKITSELEAKMSSIQEQFQTKVKPIEDNIVKSEQEAHFGAIRSAHEDFEKYRDDGSILKWIETKPKYIQDSMKLTYAKGTTADVIDLISDFKRDNGLENNNTEHSNVINADRLKAERERKKQELTSVPTRRTAVNSSRAVADDFESAFDEALKK